MTYTGSMEVQGRYRKLCRRYDEPGHAHALTFSCYRRQPLLTSERIRGYIVDAVAKARQKHAFDVWAYVIMPEHLHLLIWPRKDTYSVSAMLKSIKQSVARKAIDWLRSRDTRGLAQLATGQKWGASRFWQDGGGYDRNIRSVEALRRVVDYIHHNPVERGLVAQPDEYLWSSYRTWMLDEDGLIPIDKESYTDSFP